MSAQHTPGPWRWEFNAKHRSLHLVGGRPQYDLTIMDFARWGMGGATMRLRDTAHAGMNIMHRVHERPDWIAPEPGREHHKHWHQLLTHPDARLIAAAPELLAALREMVAGDAEAIKEAEAIGIPFPDEMLGPYQRAVSAIAKATGETK